MGTPRPNDPLTDAELDRLEDFLDRCKSDKAMNVEELDGFFAALIAGPELVMPSEYYPEIFGGNLADARNFSTLEEARDVLGLMMRHWNTIAGTLNRNDVYVPILIQDEHGVARGNDWARGFMRGMEMRHDAWADLVNDDAHGGCLIPVFMLYHEHDDDPLMRTNTIGNEQREKIIMHMTAGITQAYRYFKERSPMNPEAHRTGYRSSTPKTGRNESCPCGSGKKYKRCCGTATVN